MTMLSKAKTKVNCWYNSNLKDFAGTNANPTEPVRWHLKKKIVNMLKGTQHLLFLIFIVCVYSRVFLHGLFNWFIFHSSLIVLTDNTEHPRWMLVNNIFTVFQNVTFFDSFSSIAPFKEESVLRFVIQIK